MVAMQLMAKSMTEQYVENLNLISYHYSKRPHIQYTISSKQGIEDL